jgi:hypothetical protein
MLGCSIQFYHLYLGEVKEQNRSKDQLNVILLSLLTILFTMSLAVPSQGQPDATFTPENMEKLLQMRKASNKGPISKSS